MCMQASKRGLKVVTGVHRVMARVVAQALAIGLLVGLNSPAAFAWNESGHRIIAAAAARQMAPDLQAAVVAALRAHPRYDKDLDRYRPRNLGGLSEAEWLMGQAAQWPDRIRRFNNEPFYKRDRLVKKYHRGRWHYINLPLYLNAEDEALAIGDPTTTIDLENPANALDALAFIQAQLRDPTVALADKGLWSSWALHLIADVHQPLHTTAMFERSRWPRGDRGGNEIKIKGSGKKGRLDSLHYFWDSAISNVRDPAEINRLLGVLKQQRLPDVVDSDLDPVTWIREGHRVARFGVYEPLLDQLNNSPEVATSKEYTARTHAIALERAAVAARRTVLWLQVGLQVGFQDGLQAEFGD